jgi:histidinol dehydrogenase
VRALFGSRRRGRGRRAAPTARPWSRIAPRAARPRQPIAPEHLTDDEWLIAQRRRGDDFRRRLGVSAAGDYATANHGAAAAGAARVRGGLNAADFVRVVAVQRVTRSGLRGISDAAVAMARVEGLTAHAASIEARTT